MPSILKPDKSITREIQLRLLPEPVKVTMNHDGLSISAKGCRKPVCISWDTILDRASTPSNVPAKFFGRALEYLQSQMKPKSLIDACVVTAAVQPKREKNYFFGAGIARAVKAHNKQHRYADEIKS